MNKLQTGWLYTLTGGGFGGIIGRMYAGFKTLQHRLHHDRRPYGADDELL